MGRPMPPMRSCLALLLLGCALAKHFDAYMITYGLEVTDLLAAKRSSRRWTNDRQPIAEGGRGSPGAGACCRKGGWRAAHFEKWLDSHSDVALIVQA